MSTTPQDRAAGLSPQARTAQPEGASLPDASGNAGTLQPPRGVPAQTSRPAQAPKLPGTGGTPGPETLRPGPAAVRARVQSPAGGEHASRGREAADSSSPAGPPPGLRGAEWRAAAKRARSGRQPGRAAPRAAAKVTIPPASAAGATTRLTATADCLGRCDWTAGPGGPAEVDKLAEKHTKAGLGHPTNVVSEPAA